MNRPVPGGNAQAGESEIRQARQQMGAALIQGESGLLACRSLSRAYDQVVQRLWEEACANVPERLTADLAMVATGGWGREEMCPYSDIDFLLVGPKIDAEKIGAFADQLLYPLWDAKIKVGHGVRSLSELPSLARQDLPTATSLLDARLVAGSQESFRQLVALTRSTIAPGGNANPFVHDLHEERQRRYEKFGDSLYLLEPNIKQGIGGLRDVATAHWAARARWSMPLEELVAAGELTRRQLEVLVQGRDYLLTLRSLLQLEAGRFTDQLTFELQEAIGPKLFPHVEAPMGKIVAAVAPAVEALMRKYYLSGRGIERVANRLLESARVPARRKPRIRKLDRSFLAWNGKLAVTSPSVFRDAPEEMLRYFRVAIEDDLPLYGHTKELIEAEVARQGPALAANELAAQYFLEALIDTKDTGRGKRVRSLLAEMHAVGLVAAMIPEFGPCTGRVQHDLYHVFTVDHHQLFAVQMLKGIARGEGGEEAGLSHAAYKSLESVESLYLATLLHDVAKPLGAGHAENGARIGSNTATLLGLGAEDAAMVDFLIRHHLTMSHISQRRDLTDPDVIAKFAQLVGNQDALARLYLLTRCDTAMTAPGNLSSWKDQLLTELYLRTFAYLDDSGAAEGEQANHRRNAARRALEIVSRHGKRPDREARAKSILKQIEPGFVNALNARTLGRILDCALTRVDQGQSFGIATRLNRKLEQSELICVAEDGHAVLAQVSGVLAACRIQIDSAIITSVLAPLGPIAVQSFMVRDVMGRALPDADRRWDRVRKHLGDLFAAQNRRAFVEKLLAEKDYELPTKTAITMEEHHVVKIFSGESSEYSVVEVHTADAFALLHRIASCLSDEGLSIHRALLSSEGERVADVFYVQDGETREKLSKEQAGRVKKALYKSLENFA